MAYSLEQLEHIYEQCLNMPEEERMAFISAACGDNHALEVMLLNMLKHQQQAIEYFEQMQQTLARGLTDGDLPRLATGEKVGKYRIIRFLAKGGMSNVYLAERDDGHFEQQVVVKCLPAKALKHEDALHQAEEHQILAKLRHPNIATLYDAGITTGNVPYFIMEFIEGIPIDEYVEQKKLSIDRRLALFGQVLQAVAYAHSHLILHLDLKPGNILVNGAGHVKLLDFGIATAITSAHQGQRGFIGTPKIAAPEQLSGEPLTVSTDVYQLGMLMHKLIAGKFPETENPSAPDEKTARERMQLAAENRKIDRNLDYELAAILKKCLHIVPANRYSGAGTLLDDVRSFRQHLPVGAMEQNLRYRVAKFTQRHRTASIASVLILLALIAGTTVSLWQAKEARQQRDLALKNEQVSTATKNFLLDLFMAAHPSVNKGDTMTVFQFLDKGYEKADSYAGSPQIKLEMLTTMGKLYRSLGDYNTSKKVLAQVQAMAADSALSLSLTYVLAIQELALYQRDVGNYDSASAIMHQVMHLYHQIDYPEQDSVYASSLKNHAFIFKQLEKNDSAVALIQRAIVNEEKLWPDGKNINLAESYYILGVIQRNQMKYAEAVKSVSRSLELCENLMGTYFPGTMANLNLLGGTYSQMDDPASALVYTRKAMNIAERLYGENHAETATSYNNLGSIFFKLEQLDSAYYYHRKGLLVRQHLFPGKENINVMLSTNNLIQVFIKSRQQDSVRKYLNEAFILAKSPKVLARQRAATYTLAGDFYVQAAQADSAKDFYNQALLENRSYLPENDARIVELLEKVEKLK